MNKNLPHEIVTGGSSTSGGVPFITYAHGGNLLVGLRFMENTIRQKMDEGGSKVVWRQIPTISFAGDHWEFNYRFAVEQ